MTRIIFVIFVAAAACAQPVVAPSEVRRESGMGPVWGDYNVHQSWEGGYRFRDVHGNLGKYRSDVNFGNGVRLLGSSLALYSREGHGNYFDELLLNTQGLARDPYQFSSFRVRKNRLYAYDLVWRLNDYYNPALPVAAGQHLLDTTRTLQDHSLVLLPNSPFSILAGFSQARQSGAGLSTTNLFGGTAGDEFPLARDVRRRQNEFRIGFEVKAFGARLTIMRFEERFRDDTRRFSGPGAGNNATDPLSLDLLRRDEPYHGSTGTWRGNLLYEKSKAWSANARVTHADTNRNFIFDESASGADRFGPVRNRQILVFGDGRRPVTTGGLTLSFFPRDTVTVTNYTSFHNLRMEGSGSYRELDNGTLDVAQRNFGLLGIRTITNGTDIQVRPVRRATVFGGYQFSARRIRSVEQVAFEEQPEQVSAEQENRLHSVRAGFRFDPLVKPKHSLFVVIDAEVGRADRPFYPVSEKDYHVLGARLQYRDRTTGITGAAYTRANYNFNSASLLSHSSKSRQYGADLSWTPPRTRFSMDVHYSKLHLDTLTGIAYFYNRQLTTDRSAYGSNVHSGHASVHLPFGEKVDVMFGYTKVQDVGDSERPALARPYIPGREVATLVPGTLAVSSWPLSFESPQARLTVELSKVLRWNIGYQFYRYGEQVLPEQNYRAHTGFSSLALVF
ncbi:MAG TPA: hypothetical protein VES20_05000 [Bryobacteraceae bacterium]|nr:hypothetical protein [Bryobacteraceae bacterium]